MALKIYDTWCLSVVTFLTFPLCLKFISAFKSAWAYGFQNIWHLMSVCHDIPNFLNITHIPTIPKISIIVQISSSLWFQKGITLDIYLSVLTFVTCPHSHHFLNSYHYLNQVGLMLRRRYDIWCLSVFTDIPEILNIQDISNIANIPTNLEIPIIPEFPIIIQHISSSWFRKDFQKSIFW